MALGDHIGAPWIILTYLHYTYIMGSRQIYMWLKNHGVLTISMGTPNYLFERQ